MDQGGGEFALLVAPHAEGVEPDLVLGRSCGHGPDDRHPPAPRAGRQPGVVDSPTTRRRREALELTFREALRLGHNYIGTEHLLLELEHGDGLLSGLGVQKLRWRPTSGRSSPSSPLRHRAARLPAPRTQAPQAMLSE
ncbi:MAG: Clp protease N-terminal domain-containing protein [Acidimicrobiales bacterium]|nr:Clp protease N-terminal domain-containing protein [Acidimicrobiales bacterium]